MAFKKSYQFILLPNMWVSYTVTMPIWRWKFLSLWSLNLHLFEINEVEHIFTSLKDIFILFCEVCLQDFCLFSIGLFFSYWFVLYILLKNSPFHMSHIFHRHYIIYIIVCFDILSCRKILLYPFKFACFISCGFCILCHASQVLPCTKIIF